MPSVKVTNAGETGKSFGTGPESGINQEARLFFKALAGDAGSAATFRQLTKNINPRISEMLWGMGKGGGGPTGEAVKALTRSAASTSVDNKSIIKALNSLERTMNKAVDLLSTIAGNTTAMKEPTTRTPRRPRMAVAPTASPSPFEMRTFPDVVAGSPWAETRAALAQIPTNIVAGSDWQAKAFSKRGGGGGIPPAWFDRYISRYSGGTRLLTGPKAPLLLTNEREAFIPHLNAGPYFGRAPLTTPLGPAGLGGLPPNAPPGTPFTFNQMPSAGGVLVPYHGVDFHQEAMDTLRAYTRRGYNALVPVGGASGGGGTPGLVPVNGEGMYPPAGTPGNPSGGPPGGGQPPGGGRPLGPLPGGGPGGLLGKGIKALAAYKIVKGLFNIPYKYGAFMAQSAARLEPLSTFELQAYAIARAQGGGAGIAHNAMGQILPGINAPYWSLNPYSLKISTAPWEKQLGVTPQQAMASAAGFPLVPGMNGVPSPNNLALSLALVPRMPAFSMISPGQTTNAINQAAIMGLTPNPIQFGNTLSPFLNFGQRSGISPGVQLKTTMGVLGVENQLGVYNPSLKGAATFSLNTMALNFPAARTGQFTNSLLNQGANFIQNPSTGGLFVYATQIAKIKTKADLAKVLGRYYYNLTGTPEGNKLIEYFMQAQSAGDTYSALAYFKTMVKRSNAQQQTFNWAKGLSQQLFNPTNNPARQYLVPLGTSAYGPYSLGNVIPYNEAGMTGGELAGTGFGAMGLPQVGAPGFSIGTNYNRILKNMGISNKNNLRDYLIGVGQQFGFSPILGAEIAKYESSGGKNLLNTKSGAAGAMQVMPSTAQFLQNKYHFFRGLKSNQITSQWLVSHPYQATVFGYADLREKLRAAHGDLATALTNYGGNNPAEAKWIMNQPQMALAANAPALPYDITRAIAEAGTAQFVPARYTEMWFADLLLPLTNGLSNLDNIIGQLIHALRSGPPGGDGTSSGGQPLGNRGPGRGPGPRNF